MAPGDERGGNGGGQRRQTQDPSQRPSAFWIAFYTLDDLLGRPTRLPSTSGREQGFVLPPPAPPACRQLFHAIGHQTSSSSGRWSLLPAASCCVVPCCAPQVFRRGLAALPASRIAAHVSSRHQGGRIAAHATPYDRLCPSPALVLARAALEILNAVASRLRKRAALEPPALLAARLSRRPDEQGGRSQGPPRGPAAPAAAMKRLKSDRPCSGTVSHPHQGRDEQRDASRALPPVAGSQAPACPAQPTPAVRAPHAAHPFLLSGTLYQCRRQRSRRARAHPPPNRQRPATRLPWPAPPPAGSRSAASPPPRPSRRFPPFQSCMKRAQSASTAPGQQAMPQHQHQRRSRQRRRPCAPRPHSTAQHSTPLLNHTGQGSSPASSGGSGSSSRRHRRLI